MDFQTGHILLQFLKLETPTMPPSERDIEPTRVAHRDGGGVAFALAAVCPREVLVGLEMASSEVGGDGSMAW
jgi:hypothetical protein